MTEGLDGKFKVVAGSNFTKAFAQELGLDNNESKKLGSVWNQIYQECGGIEKLNNVKAGQEFSISADSMKKILGWVNDALGTNKTLVEEETEQRERQQNQSVATDVAGRNENQNKQATAVKPESHKGATQKLNKANSSAEEMLTDVKNAINADSLEQFASGGYLLDADIDSYGPDAISAFLSKNSSEVQLLLLDMANSRKVKLMKQFDSSFTGTTVEDTDLIEAASKYFKQLQANSTAEQKEIEAEKAKKAEEAAKKQAEIDKAKEKQRQANIKNLEQAFKANQSLINFEKAQNFEIIKNEAKELENSLKTAIDDDDLEDFASGNNWFAKDIADYGKDAVAYLLSQDSADVKLLLQDMSNSRKVKLMKQLDPNFASTTVENEKLVDAAQKHVKTLYEGVATEKHNINKVVNSYNEKIKTLAELRYTDSTKLRKTEQKDKDGSLMYIIQGEGNKSITVKFAPNSQTQIKEIEIDGMIINPGSNNTFVTQDGEKINIGSKNLLTHIRSIVNIARA